MIFRCFSNKIDSIKVIGRGFGLNKLRNKDYV